MRYVIPIILSLSMFSMGNAREEEDCNCKHCVKEKIKERIKDRAAEEAKPKKRKDTRA